MEKKDHYITTTIPYVNAEPHIGFALEAVQSDTIARYWRSLFGNEHVFYNAGTDEHGQKIFEGAKKEGKDMQAYVDYYAEKVRELKGTLDLSYDNFIRTTDKKHQEAAQEMWRRCEKDIEKKKYRGLYCVGCEKFLSERDLTDGRCPLHPDQEPIELEEENYFFKLSNYQDFLTEYLNKQDVIIPTHRLKEARQFVERGLEDFSISREKEKLSWGVPVPGDDSQVMYVWFDALTNYISTLGWPHDEKKFRKFWQEGAVLQMAGKDQVRFQSIMWPAILKSAGIESPDQIFYHGFINSGGQRMSKSLGNVISPFELKEHYGTDATRYILLRHVHPTEDTDVTWERMDEWYTANLVNGLGNLVARVMKMAEEHLDDPVIVEDEPLEKKYTNRLDQYRFDEAFDLIFEHIGKSDEYIQETLPFRKIRSDDPKEVAAGKEVIEKLVKHLYRIAKHLAPCMPETARKIQEAVKANKKPENLFPRLDT